MGARSILLLGVVTLASACGDPAPSARPVAPSEVAPASVVLGSAWEEPVPLPRSGTRGSVHAVAAGPNGWVAVGAVEEEAGPGNGDLRVVSRSAAAWTSADGSTWQAVPDAPVLANAAMFDVEWTSEGFVAVGRWLDERPDANEPEETIRTVTPAAWRSADGMTWSQIPVDGIALEGTDQGRMNGLLDYGGLLVAVGCLDDGCSKGAGFWVAGSDGTFKRVEAPRTHQRAAVTAVTVTAQGLAAVGSYPDSSDFRGRAGAWTSTDGRGWNLALAIESDGLATFRDVAGSGGVLVAVGSGTDETDAGPTSHAAAWRSVDSGRTWQRVGRDSIGASPGVVLDGIVHTGHAFVAVGRLDDVQPWRPMGWISSDGLDWRPIELPGLAASPTSIAFGPGGLVAVGGGFGPWVGDEPPPEPPADMVAWRTALEGP